MSNNKANRIERAIRVLNEQKVGFAMLTSIHFRIRDVDFWPTTGRFYDRKTRVKGRSLDHLLAHLNAKFG